MDRQTVRPSLYAGVLLTVVGLLAWATGRPFVFPSLGPSGYVLATASSADATPRKVVGGHLLGLGAGLFTYHVLASGLLITSAVPAFSLAQLRLVASGVVAVVLTTAAMRRTGLVHPPACATTLIVALGLLSSPLEAGIVVVAVVVLVGVHATVGAPPRVSPLDPE
ncbi:HPP family protein [Salinigranum halophilum]|jgi:CBS-domain-containing membrane protein|uniref:HPP family protein n=1 Tax=Salinigranum halophilum TaxID=2565931 RepID=UPI0010A888B5|nr:HPP family protein [Salinigranum halophilum]